MGIPCDIARLHSRKKARGVCPLPAAATTMPDTPAFAAARISDPSESKTAVMSGIGKVALLVMSRMPDDGARLIDTMPFETVPIGPACGLSNAPFSDGCTLTTSRAAWIIPANTTTVP